ncbi:hypothetical protein A8W25_15630 [Streptomyces sp. ERV7]|nr:hypothetical protein A8W25_15630 [Streptomyces sp. ERV7]
MARCLRNNHGAATPNGRLGEAAVVAPAGSGGRIQAGVSEKAPARSEYCTMWAREMSYRPASTDSHAPELWTCMVNLSVPGMRSSQNFWLP